MPKNGHNPTPASFSSTDGKIETEPSKHSSNNVGLSNTVTDHLSRKLLVKT